MSNFKRGDQLIFKCSNPATGWVKRVSKDGSWVDVTWDLSMNLRRSGRYQTKNIVKLSPILGRIARDPLARVFIPEGQ